MRKLDEGQAWEKVEYGKYWEARYIKWAGLAR